jgi:hypothetical protein
MKTVTVEIEQAVWERQTVEIEVEDNLEGDDLHAALHEAIEACDYRDCGMRTIGYVEMLSTEYYRVDDKGNREEF